MTMADQDDFDGDIFIYRGGRAPQHITHARIDESVNEIEEGAFRHCAHLEQVDTHDGLRRVGKFAFTGCRSLRRINLKSVVEIDICAFYYCGSLVDVEFGDRLETIGDSAFNECTSIKHLKLPSIITVGKGAFYKCKSLTDVEMPERLETIGASALKHCQHLQRIAVPLKRDLFEFDDSRQKYNQFDNSKHVTTVDLVGGVHETVASLHMESWKSEMIAEINRINQVLPNTHSSQKSDVIRQWMDSVMDKLHHYKSEHSRYVTEGITLLELALWKAKLCEKEDNFEEGKTKKVKVDAESYRRNKRITCGADMVIKNILPFLRLE